MGFNSGFKGLILDLTLSFCISRSLSERNSCQKPQQVIHLVIRITIIPVETRQFALFLSDTCFGLKDHHQVEHKNRRVYCVIFHQDNAPAHKSVLAMGKLMDLHYELLEHPPYSPELAPSDFYLFPKLKLFLAGQRFSSNQEAIAALEGHFVDLSKNHYRDGIMALEHR